MSSEIRKYEMKELPPWPFLRQSAAAKILGVTPRYIAGLANNPIPAVKAIGKTGQTVWLFQKSAINEIAIKAGREPMLDMRQRG